MFADLFSKFEKALNSDMKTEVQDALDGVKKAEAKYQAQKIKKYFVFALGLIIGLILGIKIPSIVNMLTHSSYSRVSLDNIMQTLLGKFHINQSMTDEILIVAYEYNSQEPRFFSKYFSKMEPKIYDVPVGNATGASSAAPTFFDPKVQKDGYGFIEMQIDGGIICNNPSLYAYEMAKNFHG